MTSWCFAFPTPDVVTAWGTWAGALAVAATALVAWVQLSRFTNAEIFNSTLKVIESYRQPQRMVEGEMSPFEAEARLATLTHDSSLLEAYKANRDIVRKTGRLPQATSPQQGQREHALYVELCNAVVT